MKILPQLLYQTPEFEKILVDGLCSIIYKRITEAVYQKEGFVSAHALTLVLRGELRIERENGEIINVQSNKMVFLPKGLYQISDILPPDVGYFEAVVFFFDEDLIKSFVTDNNIPPLKNICATHKILEYQRPIQIFTESLLALHREHGFKHRELTRIKLRELLHLLTMNPGQNCLAEALATLNNKERRGLREFMELNFHKPLSIEDYAYLTGRSLSSFRRDFIDQFGTSPKQWLIDRRLDRAKDLLAKNNTTVTQAAFDVGYENTSHFVKAFHQKFGVPPKQFLISARKAMLV